MRIQKSKAERCQYGRGRKIFSVVIIMVLLISTFVCAWELPAVYSAYCDKRNQKEEICQTMEVKAYSYQYATMEEKIEELSYFQNNKTELARIQLPEGAMELPESSELRRLVQKELDRMAELNILPEPIDMEYYELSVIEEYRIYPVSSEQFKGEIGYWDMIFTDKSTSIKVCMDTEFHMLYSMEIYGDLAGKSVEALVSKYAVSEKEKSNAFFIFEKVKQASMDLAINEIKYYELNEGSEVCFAETEIYDIYQDAETVKEEYAQQSDMDSEYQSVVESETYRNELYSIASKIMAAIKYGTDLKSQLYIPGYINMESENIVSVYVDMNPDSLRISLGCF